MVDFSKTNEWTEKIDELEKRAGIAESVADAKLGPFVPNFDATSEEYFDETEDHARTKVRKIYFALVDVKLRRELIHARRQLHLAYEDLNHENLRASQENLERVKRGAEWVPWMFAAIMAIICVALGAKYFGLYGAIAGAVGGFFAGQGIAASKRREQADEIRDAESEVAQARDGIREHQLTPHWFAATEEESGEPDLHFDEQSVIANRARGRSVRDE